MRARALLVVLLAGVLVTTGCSGDDDASPSTYPASTTPATLAVQPGGDLTVRGAATLDGAPLDAQFLGAVVRRDQLVTPCQAEIPPVTGGRYEIRVLAQAEGSGCGVPGARVLLWTFANGTKLYSTSAMT